jgi:hypothetical protein
MASFDRIKVGDVLYDVHSVQAGNTTMRRMGCWKVYVKSIDLTKRTAMCSWNGNPPRVYSERDIRRLRRSPPKAKT